MHVQQPGSFAANVWASKEKEIKEEKKEEKGWDFNLICREVTTTLPTRIGSYSFEITFFPTLTAMLASAASSRLSPLENWNYRATGETSKGVLYVRQRPIRPFTRLPFFLI